MPSLSLLSAAIMGGYLAAFLYLTVRSAQAAGQPVWLFGLGNRQGLSALLFRVVFAGGFLYPAAVLAAGFEPVHEIVALPFPMRVGGLLLALAGALFGIYAQHYMGASWRIGSVEGHSGAIVDTGPFRRSRNPVFVGQVAMFAGFLLARPDLIQFALVAAITLAVWLQVRIEEKVLVRDPGEPYQAYRQKVPRWL
ncbi:methyltransferase [Sinorhizobium sp. RAC02]|uniref:methyltransferase family protein n=1 Tax=Sinorhizobium sp. RAC02 TaxID=1842534 RepID=UPI00083CD5B6|nr:methyltransferase [Sinorhizobium sp. RAC02]AOF88256.1 phospholipid methyltransferase family protein [Sinorhizobium sp. RAC02]